MIIRCRGFPPHSRRLHYIIGARKRVRIYRRGEERKVSLGRWAQPGEYANLVVYLASEEAAFVTGQVVSPSGASIVGI